MSAHYHPCIVALLHDSGPLTSAQIAAKLGKTRLQVTRSLCYLQRNGQVRAQGTKIVGGGVPNRWIAIGQKPAVRPVALAGDTRIAAYDFAGAALLAFHWRIQT